VRFCVPCRTDRPAKYTCYETNYRAFYGVLKNKRYFAGRIVQQGRCHLCTKEQKLLAGPLHKFSYLSYNMACIRKYKKRKSNNNRSDASLNRSFAEAFLGVDGER